MNQYFSEKIKVVSFFSIILVLYIHSGFHDYPHEIAGMQFNFLLQDIISGEIGRCAVPMFYMISGYLFFLNVGSINDVYHKMRKRVHTLLIPYVVACLFVPLFYLLLEVVFGTKQFVNSASFSEQLQQPIADILCSLFYKVKDGGSPYAFHLWFLRDLILLVCISPILYYLRKHIHKGLIVGCLFLLTLTEIRQYVPAFAAFWFMAGDALLIDLKKYKSTIILFLFLGFSIAELSYDSVAWRWLNIPITALGVIGLWNLYDCLVGVNFKLKEHSLLKMVCGFTFFIYLFHEPALNIVRKLLVVILGNSSFGFAVAYLLSPWLFILIAIPIAVLLKRWLPRFYMLLVGSRN